MSEQRKSQRFKTSAKIILVDLHHKECLLKDISITGCRIEVADYLEIKPHTQHKLKIVPEGDSGIEAFTLLVEAKWAGTEIDYYEFGFSIVKSPKGKQFQRYVDYLSWRYSQGSSMTGGDDSEIP